MVLSNLREALDAIEEAEGYAHDNEELATQIMVKGVRRDLQELIKRYENIQERKDE
jgi:hypothetical protein